MYVYFTLQSVETDPCWLVWFVREANALGKGLSLGLCREYVSRNFTLQSVETNPCLVSLVCLEKQMPWAKVCVQVWICYGNHLNRTAGFYFSKCNIKSNAGP